MCHDEVKNTLKSSFQTVFFLEEKLKTNWSYTVAQASLTFAMWPRLAWVDGTTSADC